ncbi:MAG: hypothetical protein FJ395_06105 [Verrucomicrobia bacterium]|nr:hypothetical protein [Verrucomicrobiota bacterium]
MKQLLISAIACAVAVSARGQLFDTSAAQAELVATLMGTGRVFTANVTVKREKGDKQIRIADNVMFMREGDLRLEHKPADEPSLATLTAKLKKDNLSEVVTILLPKADKAYLVLPGKRAYFEAPSGKGTTPRMESKFLRTEKLDGHLCTVRCITVVNEDESRQQITVWEAAGLQGFILKSQMERGDDTKEILYFTNIRAERPDDAKFTLPGGYGRVKGDAAGAIAGKMMEFDLDRDAAIAELFR